MACVDKVFEFLQDPLRQAWRYNLICPVLALPKELCTFTPLATCRDLQLVVMDSSACAPKASRKSSTACACHVQRSAYITKILQRLQ